MSDSAIHSGAGRQPSTPPTVLRWLQSLLWPHAQMRGFVGARVPATYRAVESYAVLPRVRHPSLLVPLLSRASAAASMRRYDNGMPLWTRAVKAGVAAALQTGALQPFLRQRLVLALPRGVQAEAASSITGYLGLALAEPEVAIAISPGTVRANRKPVLQVLRRDGTTVGYAKVGWNDLTRRLVRTEGEFLDELAQASLSRVVAPRLLHLGGWEDKDVLIVSPLPQAAFRLRLPHQLPPTEAFAEVGAAFGVEELELTASRHWKHVRERVAAHPDRRTAEVLRAVVSVIEDRHGATVLPYGVWHGDWSSWNSAWHRDRLLLWDWERSGTGMPLGLDPLHFCFQTEHLVNRLSVGDSIKRAGERSATTVRQLGVSQEAAGLLVALYVLELFLRYDADRRLWMAHRLDALCQGMLGYLERIAHSGS